MGSLKNHREQLTDPNEGLTESEIRLGKGSRAAKVT
jgi:hypothetical protein